MAFSAIVESQGPVSDRPHTVQYYVHFPFAILSQRIHRLLNRRQIRLSVLRKEVNIGIFAVLDHLFDDGAQQAAFFLQRSRIHRAGERLDHFLMEGELLMQHPALLGEGFQLGKSCSCCVSLS